MFPLGSIKISLALSSYDIEMWRIVNFSLLPGLIAAATAAKSLQPRLTIRALFLVPRHLSLPFATQE